MHLHAFGLLELACAGLHALIPSVIDFRVASHSAVLVPSTTRGTTADSAGFLEGAAR